MTMAFSSDKDESVEQLNEYIHGLLGYHTMENQLEAWSSIPQLHFQSALQSIFRFQKLFSDNFLASRWQSRIQNFLENYFPQSTLDHPESSSTIPPEAIPTEAIDLNEEADGLPSTDPLVLPPVSPSIPTWKRYMHSSGGSASTVKKRNTKPKTTVQLKINDFNRALTKLGGMDAIVELRETWAKLDSKYGGREWQQSEGLIIGLINHGLSQKEIKAILPVGGYKLHRLKQAIATNFVNFHTKLKRQVGSTAVTEQQLAFLKGDAESWQTEDGFPCAHQRPRTYIIEEHVTWKLLHERYALNAEHARVRTISHSRWRQFIQFHFPGLRLSRSSEDVCDACVRIETQLLCPDLSTDLRREKLMLEKSMHIDAAIGQRHAMSGFVHLFVSKVAPLQVLPANILEDCIDSGHFQLNRGGLVDTDLNMTPVPTVLIQAEDFGGSLSMPHYGFNRPSADYFNSNLMLHLFVTANISDNTNKVLFYDERGQGKGADALCSLRMGNLLELLDGYRARGVGLPSYLLNILDNCVGQNKSNVVKKFFALLSILLFQKVVLLYLIPGHSHMTADRVVAWCKGAVRGMNVYSPTEVAKLCNAVQNVRAEFLDHKDPKRPFFSKWETILDKYFQPMPVGFTTYYFFEFDEGIVSMRHLASSPEESQVSVPLIIPGTADHLRSVILWELFGVDSVHNLTKESMSNLNLPRTTEISLSAKKIHSIAKKYFSILAEYLPYYPSIVGVVCPVEEESEEQQDIQASAAGLPTSAQIIASKQKCKRAPQDAVGARKPGRPKRAAPPLANQPSILTLFAMSKE